MKVFLGDFSAKEERGDFANEQFGKEFPLD